MPGLGPTIYSATDGDAAAVYPGPGGLGGAGGQRSQSERNRTHTNSVDRNGGSLRTTDRHQVDPVATPLDSIADHSVIAVFSRENAKTFATAWRARMEANPLERVTKKSRYEAQAVHTDAEIFARIALQKATVTGTDFKTQVQALLEGKSIPHVIAIIEGREETGILTIGRTLESATVDIPYVLAHFREGENSLGRKDGKQSMGIYVRRDMQGAYWFTDEYVPRGTDSIPCFGVNYKTADGEQFRSLLIHLPHRVVGGKKNPETHQAFEAYAAAIKAENQTASPSVKVTVTSYFGDTNYKNPSHPNSVASMGGLLPSGGTLHSQSSSASEDTHFMQVVPLGPPSNTHRVRQPSTLNYVFVNTDPANTTATDHPSIMTYTSHSSPIVGRTPAGFPKYYEP